MCVWKSLLGIMLTTLVPGMTPTLPRKTIYSAPIDLDMTSLLTTKSGSIIAASDKSLIQFFNGSQKHEVEFESLKGDTFSEKTDDKIILMGFLYDNNEYVLYCGKTVGPNCHIVNAENITDHYLLENSSILFEGSPAIPLHIKESIFMSALNVSSPSYTFSKYQMTNTHGWKFNEQMRAKKIEANAMEKFEFIYGFSDSDFAYYLRNNRSSISKTYLSQIDIRENTTSITYYAEIEIECNDVTQLMIANYAFFFKSKNVAFLVIQFCEVTFRFICNLCFYDMAMIKQHFIDTKEQCINMSLGAWPVWIKPSSKSSYQKTCLNNQTVNAFNCNPAVRCNKIRGRTSLSSSQSISISSGIITSVAIWSSEKKYRLYVGDTNGDIKVLLMSADLSTVKDIAYLSVKGIGTIHNMLLDASGQYLYYTKGRKVSYLRTDNCNIHTECVYCLSDTINCHWILDDNTGKGSCIASINLDSKDTLQRIYHEFCPLTITEISPLTGPSQGGTSITIRTNIPNSMEAIPFSISIGSDCFCKKPEIHRQNRFRFSLEPEGESFTCLTCSSIPIESKVSLSIGCLQKDLLVQVCGKTTYDESFVYKLTTINVDVPTQFVRLFGGVHISIQGTDLDSGGEITVHIGGEVCGNVERTYNMIICTAPIQNERGEYPVTVKIDGATLDGPNVTYIDNPVIESIWPSNSIKSGGITITLSGSDFNGLGETAQLELFDCDSYINIPEFCPCSIEDEETIVCKTEPHKRENFIYCTNIQPFDHSSIYGDKQQQRLKVLPDPYIRGEKAVLSIDSDIEEYSFKGRMLTNVLQDEISITFKTTECNITELTPDKVSCVLNTSNFEDSDHLVPIMAKIGLYKKMNIGYALVQKKNGLSDWVPEEEDTGFVNIEITESTTKKNSSYNSNRFDIDEDSELKTESRNISIYIVVACILAVIATGLIIFLYCKPKKSNNNDYSVSYSSSVSRNGEHTTRPNSQTFTKTPYRKLCLEEKLPFSLDEDTQLMFERKDLLIDRESLDIGEKIGKGNFGCVYKCLYRISGGEDMVVAAKTLHRENPGEMDVKMFLKEALLMKDFHHANVMNLVGICFGIDQLPLVILPYLKAGDLLAYLRDENNSPRVADLLIFAIDIANGMDYLAELKFVHRDLAARNCMLSDDLTVKIADFGLSRDVYEKEYYSSNDTKAKLPLKWMSPESLELRLFSSKSDVWSYGVVLWELLTRGVMPYPSVDNWDIINYLKEGRRMSIPEHCPASVYKIMMKCWAWEPDERPTFSNISMRLQEILS